MSQSPDSNSGDTNDGTVSISIGQQVSPSLVTPESTTEQRSPPNGSQTPSPDNWFSGETTRNIVSMALNLVSSIFIVFTNKWAFQSGFNFGTVLTLIHFVVTFVGLFVCVQFDVFKPKKLSVKRVLPLCAAFCGFVVLTNLSLKYNTVGFYQIAKVMTTPVIVLIQNQFYGEHFEWKVLLSLFPICVGVIISTVTDVRVNLMGSVYASLGVLAASLYQIFVKVMQKDLGADSMQLLYYQAPISALILLVLLPFTEDLFSDKGLFNIDYSTIMLFHIFASALLSFFVNLSTFLVIGRTSPITYNVLGHFKLTIILIGNFTLFGIPITVKNVIGVVLTLAGVIWYTHLRMPKPQKPQTATKV